MVQEALEVDLLRSKPRLIYDGSPLSELLHALPFVMAGVDEIATRLEPSSYLASWDVQSCFYVGALADAEVPLGVALRTPAGSVSYWRWRRWPMGIACMPYAASMMTSETAAITRALTRGGPMRHLPVGVYIDDSQLASGDEGYMRSMLPAILATMKEFGTTPAPEKPVVAQQVAVMLGVGFDVRGAPRAFMPAIKRYAVLVMLRVMLQCAGDAPATAYLPARLVEKTAGRLVSASAIHPAGRLWTDQLYHLRGEAERHGHHGWFPCRLLKPASPALTWWADEARSIPVTLPVDDVGRGTKMAFGPTTRLGAVSDASCEVGFGAICGQEAVWALVPARLRASRASSTVMELTAVLAACIQWGEVFAGHTITLATDSTPCAANINAAKGGTDAATRRNSGGVEVQGLAPNNRHSKPGVPGRRTVFIVS